MCGRTYRKLIISILHTLAAIAEETFPEDHTQILKLTTPTIPAMTNNPHPHTIDRYLECGSHGLATIVTGA